MQIACVYSTWYREYPNININAENIKSLKIPLPCLEEQQKIVDFLSEFDNAIEYAKEELEVWKNIKKGLLQQMFE